MVAGSMKQLSRNSLPALVAISNIEALFLDGSGPVAVQDIWMLAIPLYLLDYIVVFNESFKLLYLGLHKK